MSLKHIALAAIASLAGVLGPEQQARAYPVDCAILLCLAGGWPTSPVCLHARAVFIERITPFPIEPPLQIWNCPMRVEYTRRMSGPSVWEAVGPGVRTPFGGATVASRLLWPIADRADIDISNPAFDFVKSIRLFHIRFSQRRGSGDICRRSATIDKGVYGTQGEFKWIRSSVSEIPKASGFGPPSDCQSYSYRSVFVEWRGAVGGYGKEEVRY